MVKKTSKKTGKNPAPEAADFEAALKELESLVERMEQGDQTLEQSLQDFERGVALTNTCQDAIKQAEQKVETLLQQSEEAARVPFDDE